MKKLNILVKKGKEHSDEGHRLNKLIGSYSLANIDKHEEMITQLRPDIQNKRIHRCKHWVQNAWAHKENTFITTLDEIKVQDHS